MPQMFPLNWIMLFIYFIIIFIMFNILNYFNFKQNLNKKSTFNFTNKKLSWKW